MGWIDDAKKAPLADVLQHLGIGHVRGRTCAPCPACNAERRGSSDRRGPLNIHDGDATALWHCKRCDEGGDGLAAVAHVLIGRSLAGADSSDMGRVRAWFADRRWCDPATEHRRSPSRPAPPPVRRIGDAAMEANAEPPPADEVALFWSRCRRFGTYTGPDIGPAGYLIDRGYNAWDLRKVQVCRVSELDAYSPAWWPSRWLREFRIVFPAFSADGALASLHARRCPWYPQDTGLPTCENTRRFPGFVHDPDSPWRGDCGAPLKRYANPRRVDEKCYACGWKPGRKTTWPAKASARGMLFADPGGLALLAGRPRHTNFLIVEGVTDLLRASMVAEQVPCGVLGFTSGGASALGDIRWAKGATVGIATDDDKAGNAYADEATRAMPIRPVRIKWGEL